MGSRALLTTIGPTYPLFIHAAKAVQCAPFFTLGAWLPRIIHVSHTALTNIGKTTIHASLHFLSVFVILLLLVYRSGAFGWTGAAQVSKIYPSRLSSAIADLIVVRDGRRMSCFVASSFYMSHCILISIARLVDFQ